MTSIEGNLPWTDRHPVSHFDSSPLSLLVCQNRSASARTAGRRRARRSGRARAARVMDEMDVTYVCAHAVLLVCATRVFQIPFQSHVCRDYIYKTRRTHLPLTLNLPSTSLRRPSELAVFHALRTHGRETQRTAK